ncbi:hypothetical protein JGI22_00348 [Candidatus Kryptobacter tengchongensis]|nr:hypothetical protein JGI22_00348 [Candidatus Kryptobacter tengchongensis]
MKRRNFILSLFLPLIQINRQFLREKNLIFSSIVSEEDFLIKTNREPFEIFETQRLHPDYITTLPKVEYFLLGNGEIMVAIQFCPCESVSTYSGDSSATFFGLTFWNAERFVRKWTTFLYHPERGFANTGLTVKFNGEFFNLTQKNFKSIGYEYNAIVPTVLLCWGMDEKFEVEERFFVPLNGKYLFRKIKIKNKTERTVSLALRLQLYPNFGLFDEIYTDGKNKFVVAKGWNVIKLSCLPEKDVKIKTSGRYDIWAEMETLSAFSEREIIFVYLIDNLGEKSSITNLNSKFPMLMMRSENYWRNKMQFKTNNEIVNHLFLVSRNNLKATVSKSGKRDSGIWQYNMEWVRDDSMFLIGLIMCGFINEAKTMLEKLLGKFVGHEGQTIESSRWFGYEHAELDQNGQLLYALWTYACWTADFNFVRRYWEKIKLVAEFPIKDIFRDKASKLLKNKREFWERTDGFGVEEGYELAYQFWVSLGLEKAGELANKIGEFKIAEKWLSISREIKNSMLNHPKFRLIEDGHLIKRRKANGEWQRYLIPPDRKRMPYRSPIAIEEKPSAEPDTSEVLPIIYGFIEAESELATMTLDWVEKLWNQRWGYGGYERYDSSSEPQPPGPWPLASLFVARANHEAGNYERVWKVLNWLYNINGGKSGAWFEYYSTEQLTPPLPPVGFIGWTWSEIISLLVHHMLGFRPEIEKLRIKPKLLPNVNFAECHLNVRNMKVHLFIERSEKNQASVNGKPIDIIDNGITIPYTKGELKINFKVV